MGKVIWFASHLLAILVHIGLVGASIYGFVECGSSSVSRRRGGFSRWGSTSRTSKCTNERGRIIVPWASFGIAAVITVFNIGYPAVFYLLSKFVKKSESRRSKTRALMILGVVLNVLFAIADIAIAGVSGSMAGGFSPLIAICVLAALAALVLVSTVVVDVLKVKELGHQKENEKTATLERASPGPDPVSVEYPQTVNRYTNEAV